MLNSNGRTDGRCICSNTSNIHSQMLIHVVCCHKQRILGGEWETIDYAIHRVDISANLVNQINNHFYLKFEETELFKCSKQGTIRLPVSTFVITHCLAKNCTGFICSITLSNHVLFDNRTLMFPQEDPWQCTASECLSGVYV